MPKYFLMAHPHTPELRVQQLNGEVTHLANGDWQFQYRLHGNLTDLKLPAPSQAKAQDGLWQHTCFEAFVQVQGAAAYYEFNFSPSSEWAAYAFTAYRERDLSWQASASPCIQTEYVNDAQLVLTATIPAALLPAKASDQGWRIGLTAVLEDNQGHKSYWALSHVATNPDFHQAASFIAML